MNKNKTKKPKQGHENTPYTPRKEQPKKDKKNKTKSQNTQDVHSTVQYSNSYKSLHSSDL